MPSGGVATGGGGAAQPASDGAPVLPVTAGVLGMVLLGTGIRSIRRRRPVASQL